MVEIFFSRLTAIEAVSQRISWYDFILWFAISLICLSRNHAVSIIHCWCQSHDKVFLGANPGLASRFGQALSSLPHLPKLNYTLKMFRLKVKSVVYFGDIGTRRWVIVDKIGFTYFMVTFFSFPWVVAVLFDVKSLSNFIGIAFLVPFLFSCGISPQSRHSVTFMLFNFWRRYRWTDLCEF